MNLKYNHYKVTLEHLSNPKGTDLHKPVEVFFDNHDDIFNIIDTLKNKNLFNNQAESVEFAIGLKMFSEVMLRNKGNELFEDFAPVFKEFMKKLKQQ
jgi:hypothetical protein